MSYLLILSLWGKGQKGTVCAAESVEDVATATADYNYGCPTDFNKTELVSSSVVRETG